ncbi:hypothetical protein SLA2020_403560 [Shorea laevis]
MNNEMRNWQVTIRIQTKLVHRRSTATDVLVDPLPLLKLARFQLRIVDMLVIRRPQRTSALDGPSWVHWVLTQPEQEYMLGAISYVAPPFLALCNTLKRNGF